MDPEGIEDIYELSPIQEGLLFHNLYSPGTGIYLEQVTLQMRGELDVPAYQRAWQSIVDRHAVLRTSFRWDNVDRALQVVHRKADFGVEVLDWRDVSGDRLTQRYRRFAHDDRMLGFDYATAPLMRGRLLRLADREWEFFWSFSHLLMDGWSFGLAFAELAELYTGYARGAEATLAPAVPYRKYLEWWKQRDSSATERFWSEHLSGYAAPDALQIGTPPAGPPDEAQASHAVLPTPDLLELMAPLSGFAREHGLTLNTLMQGAWAVLVSRYLGRTDVLVGSTGTQRPATLPGAERIMGPMLATIPVRADVAPDERLVPWLRALQAGMARAREHADIALPDLRRLAGLAGDRPLFEVDLAFENVPAPDLRLHQLTVTGSTYDGRPHYPITMIVMPGETMPEPRMVYDRTRFGESAMRRLAEQLQATLRWFAEHPDGTLSEVDIMPAAQRRLVLADRNHPQTRPDDPSLCDMLAARAAAHPDRVAVRCGDERLTYRQLTERAHRLAHQLRAVGVGPGDRVALCLRPCVDTTVAIVAALAAGAAYVPLEPDQPTARMRYIATDAAVRALVTHQAARDSAPAIDGPVVDLDRDAEAIAARPTDAPDVTRDPHDVAYLIYPPESTGHPAGVLVTHANVLRLVAGAGRRFDLRDDDVWSMWHSYAVDGSVFEMWGALYHGARLLVVPRETAGDPEALVGLLHESRVSVFGQTPSAFRRFAAAALAGDRPTALRYVLLAGEPFDVATLRPWLERHGDAAPELVAVYGATETTVHSTCHRVRLADLDSPVRGNVGRPLPDTAVYLLDRSGRLVPPGMAGEIHVAGAGVARGYHGRPDLARQRFHDDPFADGHARMYRSGDLARWTDDGELELLGRADQQDKARGFRLAPGEAAAPAHGMTDAVVLTRDGGDDFVAPRNPTEEAVAAVWRDVLEVDKVGVHDDFFALGGHSLLATRVVFALRTALGTDVPVRTLVDQPTLAAFAAAIDDERSDTATPTIARQPRVAHRL